MLCCSSSLKKHEKPTRYCLEKKAVRRRFVSFSSGKWKFFNVLGDDEKLQYHSFLNQSQTGRQKTSQDAAVGNLGLSGKLSLVFVKSPPNFDHRVPGWTHHVLMKKSHYSFVCHILTNCHISCEEMDKSATARFFASALWRVTFFQSLFCHRFVWFINFTLRSRIFSKLFWRLTGQHSFF